MSSGSVSSGPLHDGRQPAVASAIERPVTPEPPHPVHPRGSRTVGKATVVGWLVGLAALFLVAWALRFEPPRGIRIPGFAEPLPDICNSRRMLGVDCPGCGLTRSFVLSAKQQWALAFQIHPFGAVGFGFLMALAPYRLWQGWRLWRGRPPQSTLTIELLVLAALAGGSILWWIVRLISGSAFA